MKVIFTNHAKYRLMERNISASDVRKIIKDSNVQKVDKYGMFVVRKNIGKKALEVVFKKQGVNYIIITAYYEN